MQPGSFNTQRTKLHIKNMVGNSCKKLITRTLESTGFIKIHYIALGKSEISYNPQVINLSTIKTILQNDGFDLLQDEDDILVEEIKVAVIEYFYYGNNVNALMKNSDYLSERLQKSYGHLSKVFKDKTDTTIEKYIILIKIERVKELISYDTLTLSEIAYMMGYSSVQYLSNQFKQVTNESVSQYKKSLSSRTPLDQIL